jgi:hypothetical protein
MREARSLIQRQEEADTANNADDCGTDRPGHEPGHSQRLRLWSSGSSSEDGNSQSIAATAAKKPCAYKNTRTRARGRSDRPDPVVGENGRDEAEDLGDVLIL